MSVNGTISLFLIHLKLFETYYSNLLELRKCNCSMRRASTFCCKQTIDLENVERLRALIKQFKASYLGE